MSCAFSQFKRVVVYRIGSLGDTLVVLPAFHLVRQAFPHAHITLLTNIPVHAKAAPMEAVLGGGNFYDDVLRYPVSLRNFDELVRLRKLLKEGTYDCLVYLASPKGGVLTSIRDYLFFRSCGIPQVLGVPFSRSTLRSLPIPGTNLYTSRTSRAMEALGVLGEMDVKDPRAWDLRLTREELAEAESLLGRHGITSQFLAVSAGTKMPAKDWEEHHWMELMQRLAAEYPDLPLVLFGVQEERDRSERLMQIWKGPKADLCGLTSPRVSAAALQNALAMVCHDSGPMHLAATMGVPCVAIFSARAKPGEWFPRGDNHVVLYRKTPCWDCGLEECIEKAKVCILSITVDEVFGPVVQQLVRRGITARSESARLAGNVPLRDGWASGVRKWPVPDRRKDRSDSPNTGQRAEPIPSVASPGAKVRFQPLAWEEALGRVELMMLRARHVPPADFHYILHVESDPTQENRRMIVDIFCELYRATDQHGLWLVMVGRPLDQESRALLDEANLGDRVVELADAGDDELCALYSAADLLIASVSGEELPARDIGAQFCACPFVIMRTGTGHDLGQDGAVCLDISDFWASMENLLNVLYSSAPWSKAGKTARMREFQT